MTPASAARRYSPSVSMYASSVPGRDAGERALASQARRRCNVHRRSAPRACEHDCMLRSNTTRTSGRGVLAGLAIAAHRGCGSTCRLPRVIKHQKSAHACHQCVPSCCTCARYRCSIFDFFLRLCMMLMRHIMRCGIASITMSSVQSVLDCIPTL